MCPAGRNVPAGGPPLSRTVTCRPIALVVVQFAIPPESRIFLAIVVVPVLVTAAVFVFLLATKVYTTATGVILGVLTLIPCIGLIVLLIINGKATSILKANGIHVGLFGASMADI